MQLVITSKSCVDRVNLFTNTVYFNTRLVDAIGERLYFPENTMHQKIVCTPSFIAFFPLICHYHVFLILSG